MKYFKICVLIAIIILTFYLNRKKVNKNNYEFSIEEILTYEDYKKICQNNCYISTQSKFVEYNKDFKITLYKLTKISPDESYIKINRIGSSRVDWYSIFNRYGIFCPTNIFSRTINEGVKIDYNYDFNNLDYSESEFIKIKTLTSITGLIFEDRNLGRLNNCNFLKAIILFNPSKNDFETLIIDTKTQEVYLSVEDLKKAFKFSPDNKQFINSDSHLFFKKFKEKYFSKSYKLIEIEHDTLIDFERFKFAK